MVTCSSQDDDDDASCPRLAPIPLCLSFWNMKRVYNDMITSRSVGLHKFTQIPDPLCEVQSTKGTHVRLNLMHLHQ